MFAHSMFAEFALAVVEPLALLRRNDGRKVVPQRIHYRLNLGLVLFHQ